MYDGAKRALYVGVAMVATVSVVLLILMARVVQLQTTPPQPVAQLVDTQRSSANLPARRGAILDARGRPLATSRIGQLLFVDPQLIEDPNTFSEQVGYTLDYDPAWIEQQIAKRPNSRFVVLDELLNDERLVRLDGLKLKGLATQPRLVRDYPQGVMAAQLLGFVGVDGQGLDGLELQLDKQLHGTDGRVNFLRDSRHRPLWIESADYHPNQDGQNVQLTLDATVQTFAEKALAQTVTHYKADHGVMVVLRPDSGEILAMANFPTFDPSDYGRAKPEVRKNRAVTDVFEPGSTFKAFMWSAMTQLGAARPDEMIDTGTSGLWVSSKGRKLHDAHPHGLISWDHVLILSSNIGMATVGDRVGATKLHHMVRAFGFGSPTGSGLPGESSGMVNPLPKWTHYSVTSIPMGQEVAVTALQLTSAFAAIANDGVLLQPTLHPRSPGDLIVARRVLSSPIAAHTRDVLRRVVAEGTGRKAQSKLYALFGKTGTAQIAAPNGKGYIPDAFVASFVAGAPYERPQVVVGCFIHRPDRRVGHYGGTVAAPAVKQVIEQTLQYLAVPPAPPANDDPHRLARR
jgi:cell division protein FtsI (penicillin-binding protein 3)